MAGDVGRLLDRGRAALTACDWATARSCFEAAAEVDDRAEILDGLGQALYWQGDYPRALALRERAYAGYRERGERRHAAFVAIQLAMLHGLIYGNEAAVSGWAGHARRMLDGAGDCPEHGWVELFAACTTDDPAERERFAGAAVEVGRRFDQAGLEFDALAYLGKARVEQGAIEEGMGLIDEAVAAVTSGVVTDPWAAGEIYCTLFHACELALDVRRATGWLAAVDNYVGRTGELPVSGICRMHYGGLLTAAGRWTDAERELGTAIGIYDRTYPGTRFEALLRLADLRVRQGRLEEGQQLLEGCGEHPEATGPRARLHLAAGEHELAASVVERHLSRRGRGVPSAPLLALLTQIRLAAGSIDEARGCADELAALATACAQPPVHGLACLSRARVAVAAGEDAAVGLFEEALTAFTEADLPFELARTRLDLADAVAWTSPEVARAEARAALAGFAQLGAGRDADEAAGLLRRLGDRRRSWPKGVGTLSKRESEVLGLLGEGLSNAAIAERLYISPRTAEHHVSAILSKLGLRTRAEAAAYAVRELGRIKGDPR